QRGACRCLPALMARPSRSPVVLRRAAQESRLCVARHCVGIPWVEVQSFNAKEHGIRAPLSQLLDPVLSDVSECHGLKSTTYLHQSIVDRVSLPFFRASKTPLASIPGTREHLHRSLRQEPAAPRPRTVA
ncbi:MAG: hypothetical protein MI923_25730, partial [Phycisphaerales bacterium]|nr:hypothetical protein [Phycisphaerales bacterium]